MISSDYVMPRQSKSIHQMPIFNCEGYKLQGNSWVKLPKLFIENQFDDKNNKGIKKVKIKGQKGY